MQVATKRALRGGTARNKIKLGFRVPLPRTIWLTLPHRLWLHELLIFLEAHDVWTRFAKRSLQFASAAHDCCQFHNTAKTLAFNKLWWGRGETLQSLCTSSTPAQWPIAERSRSDFDFEDMKSP